MGFFGKNSNDSSKAIFEKHSTAFENRSLGYSEYNSASVVPIDKFNDIVRSDSKLLIVQSQLAKEKTRKFGIIVFTIAFLIWGLFFLFDYISGIFSLLFFVPVCSFLLKVICRCRQINFDKRLNLFWIGPGRDSVKAVENSNRCRMVTNLRDIKSIKIQKVRFVRESSSDEYYCVFLSLKDKSDVQFFSGKERNICKLAANEVARFLSVSIEEDDTVKERRFYSQENQEAYERLEQEKK